MTSQHSNLHYIINEQRVSEPRAVKNFAAFIFFSFEDFAKKVCCLHLGSLLIFDLIVLGKFFLRLNGGTC